MMKRYLLPVFFAATLAPAQAAELTITANGVNGAEGEVEFRLFAGKEGWLKSDHPQTQERRVSVAEAVDGAVSATFTDLPPGEYGLAIYHDEDMSGELESGFMWRPKEGWAFSNNIKPRFGPPNYDKAKVIVTDDGAATEVLLRYP